jgi:hypothetical protein
MLRLAAGGFRSRFSWIEVTLEIAVEAHFSSVEE